MEAETRCALCRQVAQLRRSHIIPEFLYSSVFDEKHRFVQTSTDPAERPVSRPTGLWERLLCERCELRLSSWESYASTVLKGGTPLSFQKESWGFIAHGVEYARFKLFGMSLLWRAAVSKRPEFAAVQLGPHEERLRQLLDAEDPGPAHEYGWAMVFPADRRAQELFSQALSPPHEVRYQAHRIYRYLLGVMIWLFLVSSHMGEMAAAFFALSSDGSLRVRSGGKATMDFLLRFGGEIAEANAMRRS